MKTKIFFLVAVLFTVHLSTAQVLYTEDFESYNTGPFSTDLTGATPAQGGWYTLTFGIGGTHTVNDYKIVSDPNKGKVLQILEENYASGLRGCWVYRTDLNTYWQQRTSGNDVLKLAFDLYTDTDINGTTDAFAVSVYNNKEVLMSFNYFNDNLGGYFHVAYNRGVNDVLIARGSSSATLPADSWITIELYVDYNNDKVYFNVPSLNHTVALDTKFPLYLSGGGDQDDNPVKLEFFNNANQFAPAQGRKIDNINLSAQNFTPTVRINEFVSDKFNLYPNPATDLVIITNSENIGITEIAVYDLNGKIVKSQKDKKENEILLNTEDLNSGTYFLHIVTDEGTEIKKLIKK